MNYYLKPSQDYEIMNKLQEKSISVYLDKATGKYSLSIEYKNDNQVYICTFSTFDEAYIFVLINNK